MRRRVFVGGALAGTSLTGAYARPPQPKSGDIPTRQFGKTGIKVPVICQGGARMDLFPDVASAAALVRRVYETGLTYFDCAHAYWGGKSEEAYGQGLSEGRKNIFLTTKSVKRSRAEAEADLAASLKALKTDHLDLWQMHSVRSEEHTSELQSL